MGSITDADNFSTVTHPDDGDDADEASLVSMIQTVADRTFWLKKRLWGYGTITNNWVPVPITPIVGSAYAWFESPSYAYRQQQLLGAAVISIPSFLSSIIIKEIEVRARGRASHAALPATMPVVSLHRQQAYGSSEQITSASVSAGSVATYEAGVTTAITVPDSGLNTVQGEAYYLKLLGEAGANAIADGWEVFSIWIRVQGND